eukprot:1104493-Pyramimonas_sp.AAC.1
MGVQGVLGGAATSRGPKAFCRYGCVFPQPSRSKVQGKKNWVPHVEGPGVQQDDQDGLVSSSASRVSYEFQGSRNRGPPG